MLQRLATNSRTAAAVFMTDDMRAARGLLGEKEIFRDLEARATETHFARIRAGRIASVETSALHLDMLRDLKRINAHISAAAYPVLEKLGELLPSRLGRTVDLLHTLSPPDFEVKCCTATLTRHRVVHKFRRGIWPPWWAFSIN